MERRKVCSETEKAAMLAYCVYAVWASFKGLRSGMRVCLYEHSIYMSNRFIELNCLLIAALNTGRHFLVALTHLVRK